MTRKFTRRQALAVAGKVAIAGAVASGLGACAQPAATPTQSAAPTSVAPTAAQAEATQAPAAAAAAPIPEPTSAYATGKCEMDWTPTMPPVPKKYDPVVEVSVPFPSGHKFREGEDYTNNPSYNWVVENMGLRYVIHWQMGGEVDKLQLDIAGGTLPDMYDCGGQRLAELIDNGLVEEIRAIWEATASPLVKEKYGGGYPDAEPWKECFRGDKLYAIPITNPAYQNDHLGFIRKDLLDKVGMKVPETLEELDAALRAMHEQKLVQYGMNACNSLVGSWYQQLDNIFGAFGVIPKCWVDKGDGTLVYTSLAPENKEALAFLSQWYKDGILHPEFYTFGPWDSSSAIVQGQHAAFFAPWYGVQEHAIPTEQKIPGAQFTLFLSPKGANGAQARRGTRLNATAMWYRKGIEPIKIEATLNQLNWMTEATVNGAEKYQMYGPIHPNEQWPILFMEGYDWDWGENCELVEGQYPNNYLVWVGWFARAYPDCYHDHNLVRAKWFAADPSTLNKAQRFMISPKTKRVVEAQELTRSTENLAVLDRWGGYFTTDTAKIWDDLRKLEEQTYLGIVAGQQPLSAFDDYVDQWSKRGGDKVVAEVNEWYSKNK